VDTKVGYYGGLVFAENITKILNKHHISYQIKPLTSNLEIRSAEALIKTLQFLLRFDIPDIVLQKTILFLFAEYFDPFSQVYIIPWTESIIIVQK
jgi:hypothetical protein